MLLTWTVYLLAIRFGAERIQGSKSFALNSGEMAASGPGLSTYSRITLCDTGPLSTVGSRLPMNSADGACEDTLVILSDAGAVTLGCRASMLNSALLVDIVAQGF